MRDAVQDQPPTKHDNTGGKYCVCLKRAWKAAHGVKKSAVCQSANMAFKSIRRAAASIAGGGAGGQAVKGGQMLAVSARFAFLPVALREWLEDLQALNLNLDEVAGTQCTTGSAFLNLASFRLLLPMLLIALFMVAHCVYRCVCFACKSQPTAQLKPTLAFAGQCYFVFYLHIVRQPLALLECVLQPSSKRTVADYGWVECSPDGEWAAIWPFAVLLTVVYASIGFGFVALVFVRTNPLVASPLAGGGDTALARWRFVFSSYRPSAFCWPAATMIKDVAFLATPLIGDSPEEQALWAQGIVLVYLGMVRSVRPYRRGFQNELDSFIHAGIGVFLLVGAADLPSDSPPVVVFIAATGVSVVLVVGLKIWMPVKRLLQSAWRGFSRHVLRTQPDASSGDIAEAVVVPATAVDAGFQDWTVRSSEANTTAVIEILEAISSKGFDVVFSEAAAADVADSLRALRVIAMTSGLAGPRPFGLQSYFVMPQWRRVRGIAFRARALRTVLVCRVVRVTGFTDALRPVRSTDKVASRHLARPSRLWMARTRARRRSLHARCTGGASPYTATRWRRCGSSTVALLTSVLRRVGGLRLRNPSSKFEVLRRVGWYEVCARSVRVALACRARRSPGTRRPRARMRGTASRWRSGAGAARRTDRVGWGAEALGRIGRQGTPLIDLPVVSYSRLAVIFLTPASSRSCRLIPAGWPPFFASLR